MSATKTFYADVKPQPDFIDGYSLKFWFVNDRGYFDDDALSEDIVDGDAGVEPCPFGYAYADGSGDNFERDGACYVVRDADAVLADGVWRWVVQAEAQE